MKKKWPIDRIRSEDLPRLVPRLRPGAHHLVALVSREMEHHFWRRDDNTFEMSDKCLKELRTAHYRRVDAMLAGAPAKEGDHGEA